MNFIISGRNIDITPGLRQAVEQKLGDSCYFAEDGKEILVFEE